MFDINFLSLRCKVLHEIIAFTLKKFESLRGLSYAKRFYQFSISISPASDMPIAEIDFAIVISKRIK